MSQPSPRPPGTFSLGTVVGVEVRVQTSWIFIAVLIAVLWAPRVDAVAPGLGAMKYLAGFGFAVLLYLSVLLHEIAHAVVAQRFGLPVGAITLHFLGGMTEVKAESKSPWQEFAVAVVGPIVSILVGVASLGVLLSAKPTGLIALALEGLAGANIFVGIFNLLPGIPLDGGRVVTAAVWKLTGSRTTGLIAAGWGGRLCALAALALPLVLVALGITPQISDYLIAALVASFIWRGASSALHVARVRRAIPKLSARAMARSVIALPGDLSIAEGVRRAQEAGAGAIVLHIGSGQIVGIVSEGALATIPEDRRPWQSLSSVARPLDDGEALSADISGDELLSVLRSRPAPEYLLVDEDHQIYGVLASTDIESALKGSL